MRLGKNRVLSLLVVSCVWINVACGKKEEAGPPEADTAVLVRATTHSLINARDTLQKLGAELEAVGNDPVKARELLAGSEALKSLKQIPILLGALVADLRGKVSPGELAPLENIASLLNGIPQGERALAFSESPGGLEGGLPGFLDLVFESDDGIAVALWILFIGILLAWFSFIFVFLAQANIIAIFPIEIQNLIIGISPGGGGGGGGGGARPVQDPTFYECGVVWEFGACFTFRAQDNCVRERTAETCTNTQEVRRISCDQVDAEDDPSYVERCLWKLQGLLPNVSCDGTSATHPVSIFICE